MRSRRTVLALLGGLLAFALIAGAAASLGGITSGDLGADAALVASCDTDGVTTSYTSTYSAAATAGYKVGNVTVGGISDACDGQSMTVTLTGAADAELGAVTQAVPVAVAFTNVLDFSSEAVLSEDVTGIHVVISD
ncbi:MAG: hypothetical protein ACLGI5_00210 [Thermoleophilia bacterium]